MRYPRSSKATDVTLQVLWTSDLNDPSRWTSTDVTETMLSDDGVVQNWEAAIPRTPGQRMFVRFRVSKP